MCGKDKERGRELVGLEERFEVPDCGCWIRWKKDKLDSVRWSDKNDEDSVSEQG